MGPDSMGEDTQSRQINALTYQHHRPAEREKGYNSNSQSEKRKDTLTREANYRLTDLQILKHQDQLGGQVKAAALRAPPGEGGRGLRDPRGLQGPGLPPVGSVSSQDVGSSTVCGKVK